ncbi:MAG: hypothetical protein ACOC2G_01955 [Bacillota bacterium]
MFKNKKRVIAIFLILFVTFFSLQLLSIQVRADEVTEEEIEDLVSDLGESNYLVMNEAKEELIEIGSEVIPFLENVLTRDEERNHMLNSIYVLETIENTESAEVIALALDSGKEKVREVSIEGLIKLGEKDRDLVMSVIDENILDDDTVVRESILTVIQGLDFEDQEIVDLIYNSMEDKSRKAQIRGLEQLGRLGSQAESVIPSLYELGEEKDLEFKTEVLAAISKIGGEKAREYFTEYQELLFNSDSDIRKKGINSLLRLGYREKEIVDPVLKKVKEEESKEAVVVLKEMSHNLESAARALIKLLEDEALEKDLKKTVYEELEEITPQMEYDIDRGLVAFSVDDGVYLQWRLLGTEETDTPFNVYRDGEKVNEEPLTESTNYLDQEGSKDAQYKVEKVVENGENEKSDAVEVWEENYLSIPLDTPEDGEVKGEEYHYIANDASTADLDGDGQYEIILKWEPSNAKDNSQSGHTGNVLLDAYKLDGTRLWRIDLGRNIRAGAHYTQFLAYDFDGNGQAEVAFKTADGTEDSAGNVIGDPDADWRNDNGYILEGPEYLTIFDGESGEEMETIDYHPPRGNVRNWGDDYGNRVDRFLAGVAYLDGKHPSLVMARGYYTRTVLVAYNWRDGELTEEWIFDTNDSGKGEYTGQGSHSLSVADVDFDSKDEIVYGALVVDDDGSALHSTGIGHGDALHVSNFYPDRFGLEIYDLAESSGAPYGAYMRDAETGEILWGVHAGSDVGRGVAANISDETPGAEAWASSGIGMRDRHGEQITNKTPSINFAIWWDGDLIRELLDGRRIDKWNPEEESSEILFNGEEISSINGTKANPNLQADILGDWREEAIWRTSDNSELRIFVTPHQTEHRIHTLMHDRQYRLAIAWQNVAYNQPPHPSFYLGPEEDVPQYNPGLAHKALERFDEEKDTEE